MAARQRPLSPHLQVYKPQITSTLSIIHRATGVVNAIGGLFVAVWLVVVAGSPEYFEWSQQIFAASYGKLLLFAFSASLIYHLLNGIRHLLWDIGWGMEIETVQKTGYLVITLAILLTGLLWFVALRGGAV
jgi:succinate dehydrogenase / fumarate reductase, cytochrome b subunit